MVVYKASLINRSQSDLAEEMGTVSGELVKMEWIEKMGTSDNLALQLPYIRDHGHAGYIPI